MGIKENALLLAKAIDKEWWYYASISLYPETLVVLRKLKKMSLKVGIVTSSLRSDMEKVLAKLGLKGLFDVEVCIDDAGKAKPAK
jgi:FMN phosphatase YigB (HAD superfamily)